MFDHWLEPTTISNKDFADYSLAKHIQYFRGENQKLHPKQCVLIGVDKQAANAVRKELYPLSWAFPSLKLTDLGNLKKTSNDFIIPFLKEVMESQLFPILIGTQTNSIFAQFQSFLNIRDQVSLISIDDRIPITQDLKQGNKTHYLNKIFHQRRESLFHFGLIGSQAHFTDPDLIDWLYQQNFEYLRLGTAKNKLEDVEPLLRDGDLLSLNIDALKQTDAPGQTNPSPSGFSLEEACQLSRYAGMSDKLRSFGIYGINTKAKRKLAPTAQAVAQLIWYFIEGRYHRKGDYPLTNKGMTEYVVDWKGNDHKLTFWKSPNSGRWWLQLVAKTSHKLERHRLIPCSYDDYIKATQQELPDRLWNAFKRF